MGRKYDENALRRTGKRYDFLLSKEDESKLAALCKAKKQPRSKIIRMLIRKLYETMEK